MCSTLSPQSLWGDPIFGESGGPATQATTSPTTQALRPVGGFQEIFDAAPRKFFPEANAEEWDIYNRAGLMHWVDDTYGKHKQFICKGKLKSLPKDNTFSSVNLDLPPVTGLLYVSELVCDVEFSKEVMSQLHEGQEIRFCGDISILSIWPQEKMDYHGRFPVKAHLVLKNVTMIRDEKETK